MTWTAESYLLPEIRRAARIPAADVNYPDLVLLLEADRQLRETLVPLILGVRSEYYERREEQPLTQGQERYPIPLRAVVSVLRKVEFVNEGGTFFELAWLTPGDANFYNNQAGSPRAFYIEDDEIVLMPTPNRTIATLRTNFAA